MAVTAFSCGIHINLLIINDMIALQQGNIVTKKERQPIRFTLRTARSFFLLSYPPKKKKAENNYHTHDIRILKDEKNFKSP